MGILLGFLNPFMKWIAAGLGVSTLALGIAVGVQSWRLDHAKHELAKSRDETQAAVAAQFDRRGCQPGKPCHPFTWKAEALADEQSIADLTRRIKEQNAATQAAHEAGAKALAEAEAAVAAQRRAVAAANARAAALARPLAGADQCARSADFDRTFVGSLK